MTACYKHDFPLRKVFTDINPKRFMTFFYAIIVTLYMSISAYAQQKKNQIDDYVSFPIVIGFQKEAFIDTDVTNVTAVVEYWIQEFAKQSGYTVTAKIYDDINTIIRDIQENKLDLMHILPQDYLEIEKKTDVELAYARAVNGKKTRKYLILVHADSKITTIQELQGRTLAVKNLERLGMTYLNTLLLINNLPESEHFFSSIIEKDKTTRAILAVFFKTADACIAVEEMYKIMVELNPQIAKNLKIIDSSPEYVNILAFFRKNYRESSKKKAVKVMMELDKIPQGDQILKFFQTDYVEVINESDLTTLRELYTMYNDLKGNNVSMKKQ